MRRKTRRIFFFSLLITFVVVSSLALLYSKGYRFDFKNKELIKTGALFLRADPRAKIYINDKFKKKTNPWSGSSFIKNLLPRKYKVSLRRKGFHSWEKELEVKKEQVTEAKDIILFPKEIKMDLIKEEVERFFLKNNKIILSATNNLSVYNLESKQETSFKKIKISGLKLSPDFNRAIIKSNKNYLLNLEENTLKPLPISTKSELFLTSDPNKVFFIKKENLNLLNLLEEKTKTILNNFLTYTIIEDRILALSSDGFVFEMNLLGETRKVFNLKPLSINKDSNYKIIAKGSKLLIKEDNNLFLLNNKGFKKVFSNFKEVKFSPDLKKIVLNKGHELWILFLEKRESQPQKEQGEKVFLTRLSEEIDQVFWLNSNYLIFRVGNRIKVSEIDDRDQINIVDLEKTAKKIFWNQSRNELYLLKENNLYQAKLLP